MRLSQTNQRTGINLLMWLLMTYKSPLRKVIPSQSDIYSQKNRSVGRKRKNLFDRMIIQLREWQTVDSRFIEFLSFKQEILVRKSIKVNQLINDVIGRSERNPIPLKRKISERENKT